MEKRSHKRHARHLVVHYGTKGLDHTASTHDISDGGVYLVTGRTLPLGTRLHLEIVTSADEQVYFEGRVARLVVVAPELRQLVKSGMGVRFLTPQDVVPELLTRAQRPVAGARAPEGGAAAQPAPSPTALTVSTPAAFADLYKRELRRGGAFIHADAAVPAGQHLTLDLTLAWLGRTLHLPCTVTHVAPGQGGVGMALLFDEPERVEAELARVAASRAAS